MLKKFMEGLVFGCGFSISFVAIWYLVTLLVWPVVAGSKMEELAAWQSSEQAPNDTRSRESRAETGSESGRQFHELELEDQIRSASIIALARYERDPGCP